MEFVEIKRKRIYFDVSHTSTAEDTKQNYKEVETPSLSFPLKIDRHSQKIFGKILLFGKLANEHENNFET